jgi:F0F1-type ATP synthase assembly protein I
VNKVRRKRPFFMEKSGTDSVTKSDMLAPMEPSSRPTFQPAGAGMLLASTTAATIAAGALVGWVAGSLPYGILGGAIVGVPAGVAAVYFRYRDTL